MKQISFYIFIFLAINAFPAERIVDLDECINIALQNHPDLFLSIEDNKKSVADYKMAKSVKSVIINGELKTVEYAKTDASANSNFQIPGKDTNIGLFAGLTVVYNLYDGKKDYIEEKAKTGIDISKLKSQKTRSSILFEVKNAYYSYLLSKNTLSVREEMNRRFKKKSDLAKQLFEQGVRPILDVSKAEVDMADSQLQLEKARNSERKNKLSLFRSMGIEEVETLTINPRDIVVIPELNCQLEDLYKMAEVYSPMIRIATLEKRVARLQISEEIASHYPKVDLLFGLGYQNEKIYGMEQISDNFNPEKWSPAFNGAIKATMPIYSGGRISAKVDSVVSDYNKISYKEKELLIEAKNQIRDSFKSLEEIKKQMEISNLITKHAQRHLLLAQRSYENGGGSLLELQDAELSVIKADIGFLESKYSYLLTLARLTSIIGIGESSICKNQE
jgi:outer membrane protein